MHNHKMKTTPKEDATIARCFALLTEEQIVACEEEALEIAGTIVNSPLAADALVETLVEAIVRNAEEGDVQ